MPDLSVAVCIFNSYHVVLVKKVKYVCHLVVLKLWNVEDQQVWYDFVLVTYFTYDPESSSSLESHWIFPKYFLLIQIRLSYNLVFSKLEK